MATHQCTSCTTRRSADDTMAPLRLLPVVNVRALMTFRCFRPCAAEFVCSISSSSSRLCWRLPEVEGPSRRFLMASPGAHASMRACMCLEVIKPSWVRWFLFHLTPWRRLQCRLPIPGFIAVERHACQTRVFVVAGVGTGFILTALSSFSVVAKKLGAWSLWFRSVKRFSIFLRAPRLRKSCGVLLEAHLVVS